MKTKNYLLILLSLSIYACGSAESNTEENQEKMVTEEVEQTESKTQDQVGFLKFKDIENEELSPQLKELHRMIVETKNYASGVSVANIMLKVNDILNEKMGLDTGTVYENQLLNAHNLLKGNPRKSGENLNQAGRWLLRKCYELQSKEYPSLAGQMTELKHLLGEIDPHFPLLGQAPKVRAYIDQNFIILYLMEEKDREEE